MAFLSLHDMSKNARKGSVRKKTTATKALLSITQVYYAKNNTTVLAIRLTEKALENARMQVGDRVDVAFDPENNLWKVALVNDGSNRGYAISGTKNSARGQIRFTYYEPMPLIAAIKTKIKVEITTNEKEVKDVFKDFIYNNCPSYINLKR